MNETPVALLPEAVLLAGADCRNETAMRLEIAPDTFSSSPFFTTVPSFDSL